MSNLLTRVVIAVVLVGAILVGVWSYSYAPLPTRIRRLSQDLLVSKDSTDTQSYRAIQRMGERALPTLQTMLSHRSWRVRRAAAHAMSVVETREQAARKALQDALHDQERRVRKAAAHALGQKGWYSASAVHALASALMREKDWQVRREIAQALGRIGSPAKMAAEALERKLLDSDWSVRTAALRALARIHLSPIELIPALEQTLRDRNWQVREIAAQVCSQAGMAALVLVPLLQSATQDSRSEVRRAATTSLQDLGTRVLAKALAAPLSSRRNRAAQVLAKQGQQSALLQRATLQALAHRGSTGHRALLYLLQHKDRKLRVNAALHIPTIGIKAVLAIPELHQMLESQHREDRWTAAHVLTQLPPTLPTLRTLLSNKDVWVQRMASEVARAMGPKAVLIMIEALTHNDPLVRLTAASALGHYKQHISLSLSPLVEKLNDPYADVRIAATRSLLRLGSKGHTALLKGLLKLSIPKLIHLMSQYPELPAPKLSGKRRGRLLSVMIKTLRTGSPAERIKAARALIPMASHASPLLPELRNLFQKHSVLRVRRAAAMAMVSIGSHNPAAVTVFRNALRQNNIENKRLALSALYELGEKAKVALPELLQALQKPPTRRLAILSLSQLGVGILPSLQPLFRHTDPQVRWSLVEVVASIQPRTPAVLKVIKQYAQDSSALVRIVAQRALQAGQVEPLQPTPARPATRPAALPKKPPIRQTPTSQPIKK